MRKAKKSIKTEEIRNVMNQELNNRAKILNEIEDNLKRARVEQNPRSEQSWVEFRHQQELIVVVIKDIYKDIMDLTK